MIKPIALLLLSPLALRSQVAIDLPLPSIAVAATVSVEKTVDHLYFFSAMDGSRALCIEQHDEQK